MIQDFLLPDLGEGIDGAEVSEILVSVGDTVDLNKTVLVLESDKASMEIPTETAGVIKEILVSPGDEVKTGQLLFKIEIKSFKSEIKQNTLKKTKEKKETKTFKKDLPILNNDDFINKTKRDNRNVFASPGIRRLARELNINLSTINGTGDKGRITKIDLHNYIKTQMISGRSSSFKKTPGVDFSQWGEVENQKLTKIKKITGQRLQDAWRTIPHVTQYDEVDITELDLYRKQLKKEQIKNEIKITFLPFLMKACVHALKKHIYFNSSLDQDKNIVIIKKHFHIGIAVDTKGGLVVPVVRDVDKKTIIQLSEELMDLSRRSKNKTLKHSEMKGGTFTISSLGGIGGTGFSPIVNPPEVAIMGVSKSKVKSVYFKETQSFKPRLIMPFSISYDHRVIDGASAARFTSTFSSVFNDVLFFNN